MPISFSTLLSSATEVDGTVTLDVPAEWMQGRSAFGGLQAALALRAMRAVVPDVPLRTVQATFVAPAPAGRLRARAHVLRRGQNATHVEARIGDGDATIAVVIGVFGAARRSAVAVIPTQPAVVEPSTEVSPIELQFDPGQFPTFVQHFSARLLRGRPPFSGSLDREQVIEVDLRDQGLTTESHVLAIADFIWPLGLSHLRSPANGSTLTWMLELIAERIDHLALSGWRVDAELVAARDGYTSQAVMVWGPNGVPVALSQQSMLVFG
jgi:acyl-coenzyme A thioesterase PaaI-like protein